MQATDENKKITQLKNNIEEIGGVVAETCSCAGVGFPQAGKLNRQYFGFLGFG